MDTDYSILDLIGLLIVLGLVAGVGILVVFGGQTDIPTTAPEPPDTEWSIERLNDTHVQVGHAGGDAIPADALVVAVDGTERNATWPGTVDRGDTGVVPAASGSELILSWDGNPTSGPTVLERRIV